MAGVQLQMHLDDAALRQVIQALGRVTRDLRRPLAAIGEEARSLATEAFEQEKSPAGEAWTPSRRAEAEGGQTLSDTGQLKGSIDVDAFPTHVLVGSGNVYAAVHQFGGQAGRKSARVTLPARPFLPEAGDIDEGYIFDQFSHHLNRILP